MGGGGKSPIRTASTTKAFVRSMYLRLKSYLVRDGLGPLLVKSVSGAAGVSMFGMAFTFLLGWQLARGLGAAGYGVYGVAMAVVSILGVPSQFGLPQLLTREVASANATHDWGRLKGVMVWSARVALFSSLIILLLMIAWLILAGPGLRSSLGKSLAMGALLVPLIAFGAMSGAVLRGLLAVVFAQVPDGLVRPAVHAMLLGFMALVGVALTPANAMGAGVAAAMIALATGGMLVLRHLPLEVRSTTSRLTPSEWRAAALPMAWTEGLRIVQGQAAILALGALASLAEVGQFRVAASIMTLMAFPISVINLVTAPHVSHLAAVGDDKRLRRMLAHAAMGMTVSLLLLALPFAIAGNWLITTVFGVEFDEANPIVLVLAVGMIANAVFGIGATALNMLGQQERVTRASLWSVVVLCMTLWPAIHFGGGTGAAASVAIATTLWSAMLWLDMRRFSAMDIGAWAVFAKSFTPEDDQRC